MKPASTSPPLTIALVVAAGRGRRFGAPKPKQYANLGGRPLIRHCLEAFITHPAIDAIRVVIGPDDADDYAAATKGLDLLPPVLGGATRQGSVHQGLKSLATLNVGRVLVHDAARPFVAHAVIDRLIMALEAAPGAIPALAIADTLKRGEIGEQVKVTIPRAGLCRAQTPQAFRYDDLCRAHIAALGRELTDDAAVFEMAGLGVTLVEGDVNLDKITTADDLARAERFYSSTLEVRVGHGIDVHAFGPGDTITMCGINLPFTQGLVGHSDADVGLHALTDAILGAIGDGDIGAHFKPTDPRWRGCDSAVFLAHAGDLVAKRGGRIQHLDVTIICEAPKIGPHRDKMRARIAEILKLNLDRVSVKATTTERLGFTGRGEGIAAQAVATIGLPADPLD
jgi:2-C-methyl-D-erythritol 4-phosphate cytidylyltransferase/2-C-methyl-D-erythritol 2,4-cyclodiphosphate synthase